MKSKAGINTFIQKICILLFSFFCLLNISFLNVVAKELVPLGEVVGITVETKGVCVVNTGEFESDGKIICPARDAGIVSGDILLKINGEEIASAEGLQRLTDKHGENEIDVLVKRNGEEKGIRLKPAKDNEGKLKIGVFIKDFECGIGTLTFFDPETKEFGALGHGISGIDGCLTEVRSGEVSDAEITSVDKGERGIPGEIVGLISEKNKVVGKVSENIESGVFGYLDLESLKEIYKPSEMMTVETASRNEVRVGDATVLTELSPEGISEYKIKITEINQDESNKKGMVIEITDDRLLEKTGGIVQGMSGSPILQSGKLVGAITHVFVNDPTRGYGIFIDDMLKN